MIRNIVFDFGNVIAPWSPHRFYDKYFGSREKADWFIDNICPMTWHDHLDRGEPIDKVVNERIALYPEWEKEIRLYFGEGWEQMFGEQTPGIYDFIKDLKNRGFRILGLTNWPDSIFWRTEKMFSAFSLIEGFVISGEEKMIKPDPRIYQILFRRFGISPEESLFIDDNPGNVQGALDAGMKAIRFLNLEQTAGELEEIIRNS